MNDWKKTTDDFTRFVSDTATSFAKLVNDGAKSAADYASVMRQKLELKSQIGEHKRTLNKSYARLNMYDVNGLFHYSGAGNENLSWCYSSYSEALFLKAEAALRGWISGNAEDMWKQAIKASMDEIGVFVTRSGGKNTISADEQNAYIAALPAFGSNKEEQLRSIMVQKWIALYPNSVEAWAEQRRTGYPDYASKILTYPAVSASSGVSVGNIIQRIPYPQNEYNTNAINVPAEFADYNAKNMEKGISWSLGGENKTQSATASPKNF